MRLPTLSTLLTGALSLASLSAAQATGTIDEGPFPAELNGSNFTYPHPVKLYKFNSQLQDLEMAFMDVAPSKCSEPNGKTAILLHGKNFCGATWEETINVLTHKGYRVVAPDQVGFCKSSKPENYQFSLHQFALNTRNLLNTLEIGNVTVIGHSLGGMTATRFGLQYASTVDEIVLINAIGLEDYVAKGVPYIDLSGSVKQEASSTYMSIMEYERANYYIGEWKPEYDVWVNMLVNIYYGSERDAFVDIQARIVDLVLTQPIAPYFPTLQAPTLLIVGEKDKTAIGSQWSPPAVQARLGLWDRLGQEVVSQLPNGDLITFPDLGHAPQISHPEEFHEALVGWLSR